MSRQDNPNESAEKTPDIEFSVVSGTNDDLIIECLSSVHATMEGSAYTWRVNAIVNRPGSGLAARLRELFPRCHVVENDTPKGFATNHNRVLLNSQARYVWILNDDLVILPQTVERITAYMDEPENQDVAIVSPRLLNPDGSLQPSTYSFPSMPQTMLAHSGIRDSRSTNRVVGALAPFLRPRPGRSRFWTHDTTLAVETLRGACVAVRMTAVREVGPMVEVSLVGGEETEWHHRFSRKGWKVVFFRDASVVHYGSQTVGAGAEQHLPEYLKGALYYFQRERPRSVYRIFCLSLAGMFGIRAAAAWIRRDASALGVMRRYLEVTAEGLRGFDDGHVVAPLAQRVRPISTSSDESLRARVIAYYLPQFHVIPENEAWWGEGFTDWVNVRKAKPLFEGHYQPRVPLNDNYYDLTNIEALAWQIDLAKRFRVFGFCHYHYWFNGKQLLERPTDLMLEHSELDFPFCLAWVNTSWSRRWHGDRRSNPILVRQTYSDDRADWMHHFEYLWKAWLDPRHIRVDGKPIFLVYYPHELPHSEELLDLWRSEAQRRGLPGVHVVAMQLFPFISKGFLKHFDAIADSQPAGAMFTPQRSDSLLSRVSRERFIRALPAPIVDPVRTLRHRFRSGALFYDYDELWSRILNREPNTNLPTYPGGFVDWDNTPRYADRARIVRGATPQRFRFFLEKLVETVVDRPADHRLIFVNAWNEWAEGAYLEPDIRNEYGYLEAVRSSVTAGRRERVTP